MDTWKHSDIGTVVHWVALAHDNGHFSSHRKRNRITLSKGFVLALAHFDNKSILIFGGFVPNSRH
jgi:hypothetical protein